MRRIMLDCGLTEELKWKQPCYTFNGHNVLIVTAFKDFASINFFKGALLQDDHGLLVSAGENSQSARQIRFTDTKRILDLKPVLKGYVQAALELEKSGARVVLKKADEHPLPEELELKFKHAPGLEQAFRALTPGRQRGYLLHFTGAKQSATRVSRIEKCIPRIMEGKGMLD